MLNSVDAVVDAAAGVVDDAAAGAAADALDAFFSFLMHLVVICSSISHMIARLFGGSVAFAFCAHFCS